MIVSANNTFVRRLEVFGKHISGTRSSQQPLLKRTIDFFLSIALLIISLPVLLIACVVSFLETGASPIYTQMRGLSLTGKSFRIYKIRTLRSVQASDADGELLSKPSLVAKVTKSGAWMRRTGIDELPQLVNVLFGDMSLVGPRPLSIEDLEMIKTQRPDLHTRRSSLTVKPGLTGYWQIFGERHKGIENLVELDFYYEDNKSFSFDAFLIAITVPVALFARHSDAILGDNKR